MAYLLTHRKLIAWLTMIILLLAQGNAHAQETHKITHELVGILPFILVGGSGILWIRDQISTTAFVAVCLFSIFSLSLYPWN